MNRFEVGQKVVYIGGGKYESYRDLIGMEFSAPVTNGIYTIREITCYGIVGLRLKEIINPPRQFLEIFGECAWDATDFRPLEERKTDISIFQKMLIPVKIDA